MNRWLTGAFATCLFELRRSFSVQRTSVTLVLILFPPMMLSLIIGAAKFANARHPGSNGDTALAQIMAATPFFIVFLVALVVLLTLLLWATPNVYSELEGRSWGFIASRPGGRLSLYLGKYFAAVLVTTIVATLALSASVYIADRMLSLPDPELLWRVLLGIFVLASIVYGAIFSMFGTLFYKRGMVVAAGYIVASEFFLSLVPAIINKLTMRYHLQELAIRGIGFFLPFESESEYRFMYGLAWPIWGNLAMLLGAALVTLSIGGFAIVNRQYITSDES